MHIQFIKPPDPARERRQIAAVSGRQLLVYRIAGAVCLVVGGLQLADSIERHVTDRYTGYILAVALVAFLMPPYAIWRTMRRNADVFAQAVWVDVTDSELAAATTGVRVAFAWSGIKRVAEARGFWVCYQGRQHAVFAVPLECLNAEQVAEMRGFLVGRGLLPGAYRL